MHSSNFVVEQQATGNQQSQMFHPANNNINNETHSNKQNTSVTRKKRPMSSKNSKKPNSWQNQLNIGGSTN